MTDDAEVVGSRGLTRGQLSTPQSPFRAQDDVSPPHHIWVVYAPPQRGGKHHLPYAIAGCQLVGPLWERMSVHRILTAPRVANKSCGEMGARGLVGRRG